MRGTRTQDGFCETHLATFGPACTRCESEVARREAVREQVLAGQVSIDESTTRVPEWAPAAAWFRVPDEDADEDADCL